MSGQEVSDIPSVERTLAKSRSIQRSYDRKKLSEVAAALSRKEEDEERRYLKSIAVGIRLRGVNCCCGGRKGQRPKKRRRRRPRAGRKNTVRKKSTGMHPSSSTSNESGERERTIA